MHGCGNDFVFIDNRNGGIPRAVMSEWAVQICNRKLGVGADGLVFLENTPPERAAEKVDYIWHFYNADGSRGEMCGNASRCASWLAMDLGMAGPEHILGTDAGPVRARVDYNAHASTVELTPPHDMVLNTQLDVSGERMTVHFVNTGVPHAVLFVPDNSAVDVDSLGRALRQHPHFAPAGTNVNFVTVRDKNALLLRTYERGVEGETLACGTGAAASVVVAHSLGLTSDDVSVTTSGGEVLGIRLRDGAVFLSGAATRVFRGNLEPDFMA